ncbi:MAG TPA: hypothetical protein VJG83_03890 [archaeon]|nr:hypothetical protein [archaeon]
MKFYPILVVFAGFFLLSGCVTIDLSETNQTTNETVKGANTAASCGNGFCESSETLASCIADCTYFIAQCGNLICENGETPVTCEQDCRPIVRHDLCGNGICDTGEYDETCPQDCPLPDPVREACGNRICDTGENNFLCPTDCEVQVICGDGGCSTSETPETCSLDCGYSNPICGNAFCEPGESAQTCPVDCSTIDALGNVCGNDSCEPGETREMCLVDCRFVFPRSIFDVNNNLPDDLNSFDQLRICGNYYCESNETEQSCPRDCGDRPGFCGDGFCAVIEGSQTCPQDCRLPLRPETCGNGICDATEASTACWTDCSEDLTTTCGDGICAGTENAASCSEDCWTNGSGDQFPSLTVTVSPSNPSQSTTFNLTVSAQDDVGIDQIFWSADKFIPDYNHLNSFDCNMQTTCTHSWAELIAIEEGTIRITVYATDSSGQQSGRPVMEVNVGPFRPYTVETGGAVCGNGSCQSTESPSSCPSDCNSGETVTTMCGNSICETSESSTSCPQDCSAAPSGPICNNNIIEGSEVCDGTSLSGQTCQTQGFTYGTLRCNFICSGYDRSNCSNTPAAVCGNGTCEASESETSCAADCSVEDECSTNSDCGYKQVCEFGECVSVECTNSAQCGTCQRCSDNMCRSCGYGPYGCYC